MQQTLFLITLVVCALAIPTAENYLGNSELLQRTLKNIDQSEFGKNVLDTIALQMENGAPMTEVSTLIRDMMQDLASQQQTADNNLFTKKGECGTSLDAFEARITHAGNEITEAVTALGSLNTRKQVLLRDIGTGTATLGLLQSTETSETSGRAQAKINFFSSQEQTKQVLEALQVIIPKIKAITPHTEEEVFMELAKLGKQNPIAALVQVSSALSPESLTTCIGLLEKLQNDFAIKLDADVEHEVQSQVDYDNLMIEIAAVRLSTTNKLGNDNNELINVNNTIDQQTDRLNANALENTSATNGRDLKTTECNTFYSNYDRDTISRQAEIGVLNQVANIIATRLQGLDDFMQSR